MKKINSAFSADKMLQDFGITVRNQNGKVITVLSILEEIRCNQKNSLFPDLDPGIQLLDRMMTAEEIDECCEIWIKEIESCKPREPDDDWFEN